MSDDLSEGGFQADGMNHVIRFIDVVLSLVGIVLLGLLLPAVWVFLRIDSKGPLFYKANRIGINMQPFMMYKFRTMVDTESPIGECLSTQFDPRVTPFGRFLRRTKLNEFPQMVNILKGEMSFVGPRPESIELAEDYPYEARVVFSVKPGLVGPATIRGRNEEEQYPPGVDIKRYYIEKILPNKVKLDSEYILKPSLLAYFKFLSLGIIVTLTGVITKRISCSNQNHIYLLIMDIIFAIISYIFAYNICVLNEKGYFAIIHSTQLLPVIIIIRLLCNQFFGVYSVIMPYISYYDVFNMLKSGICGTVLILVVVTILQKGTYSISLAAVDLFVLSISTAGLRLALIQHYKKINSNRFVQEKREKVLIYGASESGLYAWEMLLAGPNNEFDLIGFIDDDQSKFGKTIKGKKVLGHRYSIADLAVIQSIDKIIIPLQNMPFNDIIEIKNICSKHNIACEYFSPYKTSVDAYRN